MSGATISETTASQASVVEVAALFVDPAGVYAGLPGVELWDEVRDARLYAGPWPVVAHPPCKTWSLMANCRPEIPKGEDGGCFASALSSVRIFGGVLEHPAYTRAWAAHGLTRPARWYGWTRSLLDDGWVCCVDQSHYGHRARKLTWLYYVGPEPPSLIWGAGEMREVTVRNDGGGGRDQRSKTPPAFRDVLLAMAVSARPPQEARKQSLDPERTAMTGRRAVPDTEKGAELVARSAQNADTRGGTTSTVRGEQ